MVIKTTTELDKLIREVLLAVGADERNANRVAEALVLSTLRGVDTHGILHLPSYVEKIQDGEIVPYRLARDPAGRCHKRTYSG